MLKNLTLASLLCTQAAIAADSLVISAGDGPMEHALVEFTLPKDSTANTATDGQGRTYAIQKSGSRAAVLLPAIKGDMKLKLGRSDASSGVVKIERDGKKLKATAGGKALLEYQAEPGEFPRTDIKPIFQRGGYIHPIYSLSGKVITDDFPPNHIHHHGVWFAWSNAEFEGRPTDFWNMGDGKGLVEFVSVGNPWSGPAYGGFTAKHRYVGGGLVGNGALSGQDAVEFMTRDGVPDRSDSHAMHARWCDIHGVIDRQQVGVAVLGPPRNFRVQQPMRVQPTEPFFNFAPQQ